FRVNVGPLLQHTHGLVPNRLGPRPAAPNQHGLVIRNVSITAEEVHAIQAFNKQVAIFEVRSPKGTKIAFNKAPDYLITDELRTALAIAHQ
ncbi:MAG: hypothetical protein RL059_1520, partial [Bacteroidota bacterium]